MGHVLHWGLCAKVSYFFADVQGADVLHIPLELASQANVQLAKDVKVTSSGTPHDMQDQ